MAKTRDVPWQLVLEFDAMPAIPYAAAAKVESNVVQVSFGPRGSSTPTIPLTCNDERARIIEQVVQNARMLGW
jgi:hypothetical protein